MKTKKTKTKKNGGQLKKMIEDYRKLLDLIMSEGLAKIDSLSDEELRKVMLDENL